MEQAADFHIVSILGEIIIVVICLIISFFMSGTETAITAASAARMHSLENEGNKRAALVNKLRLRKDRLIGALLIGNNIVNILASTVTASIFINLFGDVGVAYATAVMTVVLIIFSEVLPKTYALHHADKMALMMAPILTILVRILSPFSDFVGRIVRFALRLIGIDLNKVSSGMPEEELRGVIELYHGTDDVATEEIEEERAMLRSILDLNDISVEEVMVHRKNVQMIDAHQSLQEIVDSVLKSKYTRMPVYQESDDNIIGVIEVKLLLIEMRRVNADWSRFDLKACMREPWFIPESTTLFDQLQAFRQKHAHFALVVDEYGQFMGVITLEDILEEIVGEIGYDAEREVSIHGVRGQKDGSYLVEGKVTIRELNREFGWALPDEDYTTIAGLLLYETRRIPEQGQSFIFYDFRFDVMRRHRNQLTVIKMKPLDENGDARASLYAQPQAQLL
jgi:Mg2+/Co2+ transporter CorB